MISDELQIDNYDESNLHVFEEHICPQDMTSDKDNQSNQEELLQQEGFKKKLRYNKNLLHTTYIKSKISLKLYSNIKRISNS